MMRRTTAVPSGSATAVGAPWNAALLPPLGGWERTGEASCRRCNGAAATAGVGAAAGASDTASPSDRAIARASCSSSLSPESASWPLLLAAAAAAPAPAAADADAADARPASRLTVSESPDWMPREAMLAAASLGNSSRLGGKPPRTCTVLTQTAGPAGESRRTSRMQLLTYTQALLNINHRRITHSPPLAGVLARQSSQPPAP